MGIGTLEKMKPTWEVPTSCLELVRTSVLETLQADFYHNPDEHAEAAIKLHKEVAERYPNFYKDIFSDPEFTDYFLDAHLIMSLPYLLQDEENIDIILKNILEIQPNRIEDLYRICKMKELFGITVPNKILRKIFEIQTKHIENEKGKEYIGFLGVKYASGLKNIMASIRVRKRMLTPTWREVMDWAFLKPKGAVYATLAMREASKLRHLVKKRTALDFNPQKVPFTIFQGYAKALGLSEEEIFKKGYKLMTKNEVRRYLNALQEHGVLDSAYHKKKIEEKVMKVETDLVQLFYALKVLDEKAKDILLKKGKEEFDKAVNDLEILKDKKISVAIDCSGGCAGHSNMLDPKIQKKIIANEPIPKWAKIVQRESFNANILLGKVITDASGASVTYLFNEIVQEVKLPETFEELVEELKKLECSGGSNILDALENAISDNPDIVFIITDLNENVPFMGALKARLEEIAKKFSGTIIFVVTETVLERAEAVLLDDLIREKGLQNVFIIPVHQLKQLKKGFILIKLLEKAKKVYATTQKKKKKKEVTA